MDGETFYLLLAAAAASVSFAIGALLRESPVEADRHIERAERSLDAAKRCIYDDGTQENDKSSD